MKKFYNLLVALFLVNGAMGQGLIPALSTDASAQRMHPALNLQHRTLNSMINVQGMMGKKEHRSLIPIYDSVYNWRWDTLSTGWKIYSKIRDIVYDAKYNVTSYIEQYWIGTAWVNSSKRIYTYDANHNQTSFLSQDWNGSSWQNNYKYTYTYDASNNQTSELYQVWNGTVWENGWKNTLTYDVSNNLTSTLHQGWNGTA